MCLSAQASTVGGTSLGGVTSSAGVPYQYADMAGAHTASPAKAPATSSAPAADMFGGDLFGASGQPQSLQGSPARPPLPQSEGMSPLPSQSNSPARRASKSAFDDLNDSIRAALGSPAKQTGPMGAQAPGAVGAPGMPGAAGGPGGSFGPGVPGAQFPSGLVGLASPAKQPVAAAGD